MKSDQELAQEIVDLLAHQRLDVIVAAMAHALGSILVHTLKNEPGYGLARIESFVDTAANATKLTIREEWDRK